MSWALKPKLPDGASFSGQIVYPTTDIEFPDTFKNLVEGVRFGIVDQYLIKETGFEKTKYRRHDESQKEMQIMLVGNMPRWASELLTRIATAINGPGMILQFYDDWVTGSSASPITYECRWINAGDFVENSHILTGGSLDLIIYSSSQATGIAEYQKVINTPVSGIEWEYNINAGAGITEYVRVIG